MIRFIYNLLWPLGLLFFLPGYFTKMLRRGGYREKFGQRLGIYDRRLRARLSKQRSTWLHAVSVGEVNIALKLANALRTHEPDLHCALTTTTTTGFALARKNAPLWIEVMYTPLDYWPIMRRAFSFIRPVRIVLVEAEIWPNLAAEAHARRIPLGLVNARLSARSERRYRQFRFFIAPTFRLLDLVCVPEKEDAGRWAGLGVSQDRIRVTGSIKYDPAGLDQVAEIQETVQPAPLNHLDPERHLLFGGSTHRGGQGILAKALCSNSGAIQVQVVGSLEGALAELLRDSKARQRLVLNAHEVLSEHRGATARAAALIHELGSDPGNNKL